jgi:acetyltransferase-like isoleucine patch superfamily enzyme
VIGTNAVVPGEVPANAVVGGVPARVLRMREDPSSMRWV